MSRREGTLETRFPVSGLVSSDDVSAVALSGLGARRNFSAITFSLFLFSSRRAHLSLLSFHLTLQYQNHSIIMSPALFEPLQIGDITVQHRIALAPLTRVRADEKHVHHCPSLHLCSLQSLSLTKNVLTAVAAEYYGQRAAAKGTLLITEATFIAPQAGGMGNVPGIYDDAQVKAWKEVVDAGEPRPILPRAASMNTGICAGLTLGLSPRSPRERVFHLPSVVGIGSSRRSQSTRQGARGKV